MLVLTRKPSESIVIGDGSIVVTVVRIGPNSVRLGVSAPPGVAIHRQEIFDRIQQQEQEESRDSVNCPTD